ncbi:hypothetical protein BHU72_02230 [Desulfuribacillus stibiiarsenatis]|uniref:Elp3/MiaA/NifB-like radical SAM core domain-containing protein n=1 Tax=Desulfuribacillus stibiiarsenatis TaxID=1390249 RepID=A0A1E5L699_9FIRM|nr:hypothetical protein [Desulfuribacillus stibiiarsenatis]OEH85636.1 hypothetical protein BHU72_02230 [Desulfuribacillus stibiiarsenatis]
MEPILHIASPLVQLLSESWKVRQMNFPMTIHFDYPERTPAVSLTGSHCELDCAHCGGHYLKGMADKQTAHQAIASKSAQSCLISGGCNHHGAVNVMSEMPYIESLKQQLHGHKTVNMHVGVMNQEQIRKVADVADIVSYDLVGDDETIAEVYGTDCCVKDYEDCYVELRKHTQVVPHICIGLRGGKLGHEFHALEILQRHGAESIVFIVFIPTKGTRYADRQPPVIEEVIELIAKARLMFPNIPISLGCMRPKGAYRAKLDCLAIQAGVNRMVIPTAPARMLAEQLQLTAIKGEECCVL